MGLYGFSWNDYEVEARPAFTALAHGHVLSFLRLVPAYGGSLVERAPFALIPGLWAAASSPSIARSRCPVCSLPQPSPWLCARMRGEGRSKLAGALAVWICVANPVALSALELGHPEELLGACLCVAAVILAARNRPVWAGVALGVAFANKEWALFQPWQVWWFLGSHGALVHGLFGEPLVGYRTGPSWTGTISHPLIIAVGLGVSGTLWLHRRRQHRAVGERSAMLALALVLLLRCMLDTWDTGYYALPFVIALLAWEVRGASRPPIFVLAGILLPWFVLQELATHDISADTQAVLYLAWALPLAGVLAMRLFSSRQAALSAGPTPAGEHDRTQDTTVSVLGKLVSTS